MDDLLLYCSIIVAFKRSISRKMYLVKYVYKATEA